MMSRLLIFFPLLLCSCASQTFYSAGTNDKGATVAVKSFQNYGDLVGNVVMTGNSLTVTQPTEPIPVSRIIAFNKKGEYVGVNEVPMMAGVYNSRVNDSMWGGASKAIRSISNLAGTIGAVMFGGAVVGAGAGAIP